MHFCPEAPEDRQHSFRRCVGTGSQKRDGSSWISIGRQILEGCQGRSQALNLSRVSPHYSRNQKLGGVCRPVRLPLLANCFNWFVRAGDAKPCECLGEKDASQCWRAQREQFLCFSSLRLAPFIDCCVSDGFDSFSETNEYL